MEIIAPKLNENVCFVIVLKKSISYLTHTLQAVPLNTNIFYLKITRLVIYVQTGNKEAITNYFNTCLYEPTEKHP